MTDTEITESPSKEEEMEPFEARAEKLLSRVFMGIHHVYSLKKFPNYLTCIHHGELSSFDSAYLTRLVIAAHEYCLRVWITGGGPGGLKVWVGKRINRDGEFYDRHPTLETAIAHWNSHAR